MGVWETEFEALAGPEMAARYREAFPGAYRRVVSPRQALRDIRFIEGCSAPSGVDLWPEDPRPCLRFYLRRASYLDEWLPLLRNLGLRVVDQHSFRIHASQETIHLRCFQVEDPGGRERLTAAREGVLGLLTAILAGRVEDDPLNGLALVAGLDWRRIDVLRGYRNYYLQLDGRGSRESFHRALLDYPEAARLLCEYFRIRFDPGLAWPTLTEREEEGLLPLRLQLQEVLAGVDDLHADRLLRMVFNLIDATVRTNFFRPGAEDRFAFKLSGLGVIEMPAPRPLFEIYVHHATMEAVHLRGSRVARGGIRWSERREDFRTEIWELMRTQMLKNALIVPEGAKGGFVVKRPNAAPSDLKHAYINFMRALLDLTDNREDGRVVHPSGVLCYDGDDDYLVVAADKGTARLSDTANQVAADYRFWLGDAFASGGSHGYDHKQLGITAKGAWECARRHFRELDRDLDRETVTAIGIGSMDGDVFGNGMLLSSRLKLLAAFSGRYVFIDPDPDPEVSYRERKRLFEEAADWDRYDRSLISEGGGVWLREAKEIHLSPRVRRWLGIRQTTLDGERLMHYLLTAEADLLWLGGIGTYVKAEEEKNEAVGDPGNDGVRVDGRQLKVSVVAEGANLGFTQKGRIEYALSGGKINLDAIDNSGGVDLSDHEVNFKILLDQLQRAGKLEDTPHRWLDRISEAAVAHVLAHNAGQGLGISLEAARSRRDVAPFLMLADRLENAGLLDRRAEDFPGRETVMARSQAELTRPELAVLSSHAKMQLKQALLARPNFLCQDFLHPYLTDYFPPVLAEHFGEEIASHPLAREITATGLSNFLIDRAGVTFLTWVEDVGSSLIESAVGLYLTFDAVIEGQALREALLVREEPLSTQSVYVWLLRVEEALALCCRWFLEQGRRLEPKTETLARCRDDWRIYTRQLSISMEEREAAYLLAEGLPEALVQRLMQLQRIREFPVLVGLTLDLEGDFAEVARIFREVAEFLGVPGLLDLLAKVAVRSEGESRLQNVLEERLESACARLTRFMVKDGRAIGDLLRCPNCLQKFTRFQRLGREVELCPPGDLNLFAALTLELEGVLDGLD
ncbi:MAG: hypothetical protein Kow0060_09490 [Methylohalobius crimeensis]